MTITEAQKKRITVLNFMMTCVIVMFHSDLHKGDPVSTCIGSLATLAMCFFFWVTACLLFRDLSLENYLDKIYKRLKTLLVPYLLWQFIFWIKDLILGGGLSLLSFLKSVFLLQGSTPDGALWYVYMVFWLAVISPSFLFLFKHRWISNILLLVCVPLTFFLLNKTVLLENSAAWLKRTVDYFGAYYYGAYYGHYVLKQSKPINDITGNIFLCVAVCFVLNPFVSGVLSSCITCVLPMILFLFFPVSGLRKKNGICNISFLVYAIHQPVVQFLRKRVDLVVCSIISNMWVQSLVYYLICLIMVIIAAELLYISLKMLMPKVLNVLTGDRVK